MLKFSTWGIAKQVHVKMCDSAVPTDTSFEANATRLPSVLGFPYHSCWARHSSNAAHVRSSSLLFAGVCFLGMSFITHESPGGLPQDEPIVQIRSGLHSFTGGERVSLVEFLAPEVRRYRRREHRGVFDRVVPLSTLQLRRRRPKLRSGWSSSVTASATPGTANFTDLVRNYWSESPGSNEGTLAMERSFLNSPVMKRILVAEKSRVLFCPISNVASGSLADMIEQAEGAPRGSLPRLSNFAFRDRERFLTRRDIYRFTFVRHPFLRALAAYEHGISSGDLDSSGYRYFTGLVRGRPLHEEEHELQALPLVFFLSYISQQKRSKLDEQFLPQVDICGIGPVEYSLVGKLERFSEDMEAVKKHLGIEEAQLTPARRHSNATAMGPHIFTVHKHRVKASKLYRDDLAALGYSSVEAYKGSQRLALTH
jgi:hypothetical protein